MISYSNLDENISKLASEQELLDALWDSLEDLDDPQDAPQHIREFYSLTGSSRSEFIKTVAEAQAKRIEELKEAQAEGIRDILEAQADGIEAIGKALEKYDAEDQIVDVLKLLAVQEVADSLAEGEATKLFLPQNIGNIFSILGGMEEVQEIFEENGSDGS
jgi:regulator of protease activity HflC (stomatin/prohibitin superfamily)